jgi:hypothetical protein
MKGEDMQQYQPHIPVQNSWRQSEPPQPFKRELPMPLPQANLFSRKLAARVLAQLNRCSAVEIAEQRWPDDRALAAVLKATSAPAMTTVTGWAKELAQTRTPALDALGAASTAVEVLKQCLVLNFDGAGAINVPALVAAASNSGFVAEGDPIPVRQLAAAPSQIVPKKVGTIAVLSRELLEGSSNAEALISDTLIRSSALAIDAAFFDNAAATTARPAGIRNGISTTTASNNADPFAAFLEDIGALVNSVSVVGSKGPFIIVANAGRAVTIALRYVSEAEMVIPVAAAGVGNDIIVIAPQAIAAAFSPDPDVEVAKAGTLVMDSGPTVPVAGTTGPERELFQTDTIALKVRWPISWVVRDTRGVAWTTPTWK